MLESTTSQSAYTNACTSSPATTRTPNGLSFCSETAITYDRSYKTTEQSHQQPPWLNGSHSDHHYTAPEISSRRQDDHYSRRDICPTSSIAYQQSPHVSNPQAMLDYRSRDHDRSSGATSSSSSSGSSGSSKNWSAPSGSSLATGYWGHSTHDNAGNKVSDLFPLLYANSVLASYSSSSSHQDKSHTDYHYGSNHYRRK